MSRAVLEREPQINQIGVIAPPPILVQTPTFEGTLVTLFRCVREHKVDLMDVPLAPICEAYFSYVLASPEANLDEAASALTVLAYLIERKAWLLLPSVNDDEPEFEEPAGLPDPTTFEYSDIMSALNDGLEYRSKLFFRTAGAEPGNYEVPLEIGNVTTADLARALEKLLRKAEPTVELLSKPRRSIQDQMRMVFASLKSEFTKLEDLFIGPFTRTDAVYWFLSLLELMRLNKVAAKVENGDLFFAKK